MNWSHRAVRYVQTKMLVTPNLALYNERCLSVSDALVCTCLHLFALVLRNLVIRLISSLYRGSAKDSY